MSDHRRPVEPPRAAVTTETPIPKGPSPRPSPTKAGEGDRVAAAKQSEKE